MKLSDGRLKPLGGFSHPIHQAFLVILPAAVLALAHSHFGLIAVALIVLSKWRILAVRPRFWLAILRANAVDIIFGVSIVLFMTQTTSLWWQLLWAVVYGGWLIGVKPASGMLAVSAQAILGQLAGLSALYLAWSGAPLYALVALTGLICYLAARHFFDSYDEPYAKMLAYIWGYFGAALIWVLGHWLLFDGVVAQPTLFLSALGYGLAVLYYFDHTERLSASLKRQFVLIMVAIVVLVLIFSDWSNKVV